MLVDSNNAYHQRSRHRTLPKAPKDSRSKSLSRKEEGKHSSSSGVMRHSNQLSSSSQQLSGKTEAAAEVPVIVDEVTKWISGVNKNTTCRDIISVILRRNNQEYKVTTYFINDKGLWFCWDLWFGLGLVIWLSWDSSNQLDPVIQLTFYLPGVRCPQIHFVRAMEEGGPTAETFRPSSGDLDRLGPGQAGS